jgi:uncharacterized protein YdaU (DUF1376 family)
MAGLPWYAFYPADYQRRTAGLTMVQDGAYRRLMDQYYLTGEPLPAIADELLRICRAFADDEKAAITFVLSRFFVQQDDGWHHERIDDELSKRAGLSQARAKAGKKGAAKTNGKPSAKNRQMPTHSHTQSQEEISSLRSDIVREAPKQRTKSVRRSLPEDFPGQPERDWAQTHWLGKGRADLCNSIGDEVEKFRDHHRGRATTSADWAGSWRTWARNAMNFSRAPVSAAKNTLPFPNQPEAKILKVV